MGAAHQVGTGADSSTGFSSSVCAQAKAHSNSLIIPAGFSGQGKAVVGQLHPATCSRLCKALCHLLWSLQTQHPLPCSLHLALTFLLFFHPPLFLKLLLLIQLFLVPSSTLSLLTFLPRHQRWKKCQTAFCSVSDTFSSLL